MTLTTRLSTTTILVEKPRISSIDIMRGIVMVIMALDHVRDFYHADAFVYDPTDMSKTHPLLFFTRWITHFCAPTFVLLSGIAARISQQRKTKKELSAFLLTRGLWLILLEVTVIRFSFFFNLYYDVLIFQVIWVIGASMVVMAALVYLPQRIILIVGLVLIFGHNALENIQPEPGDRGFILLAFLRNSAVFTAPNGSSFMVMYPLIPWLGIMLTGYGIGSWYTRGVDAIKRKKLLFFSGFIALSLFIILRFINGYGDPSPWAVQKNGLFTFMSFLNCTKYPVSLLYTLMTLGPVLLILPWMENIKEKKTDPLIIFGRVPLFYYIVHFYLIHVTALILNIVTGQLSTSQLDFHFANGFGGLQPGMGFTLPWTYVAWLGILIILYPICKWYNEYKSVNKRWWLSYV